MAFADDTVPSLPVLSTVNDEISQVSREAWEQQLARSRVLAQVMQAQAHAQAQAQAMQAQAQAQAMQANAFNFIANGSFKLSAQGLGAQISFGAPAPMYSCPGLLSKVQAKTSRALDQLPMGICAHINRIDFYPNSFKSPMRFTVVFDNDHTVSFDDVDDFPSEAHIARIALECP